MLEYSDFEDGHYPGNTTVKTKLVQYPTKQTKEFFSVFDNLLSDEWCTRIYQYAVERNKPWGFYINTKDALDLTLDPEQLWESNEKERAVALIATRTLIYDRARPLIERDINLIDGTAVWCLASGVKNEVQYHIDYAELYRYETNILCPPILAGTFQVSPVFSSREMIGGAFMANIRGVEHYKEFGYKGKLQSKEAFEHDLSNNINDWMTVNYRYNRGILHDGNYPHLSTPVSYINNTTVTRRVILGFNCFPVELKECNERAPEHSDTFNKTIKWYQRLAAMNLPITSNVLSDADTLDDDGVYSDKYAGNDNSNDNDINVKKTSKSGSKISLEEIKKNPALAKLLISAAKIKKREDALKLQQQEQQMVQQDQI